MTTETAPAETSEYEQTRVARPRLVDANRVPSMSAVSLRSVVPTLAACAMAYLYGSLPVVYLLGRQRRIDLREIGSGNVGATNLMMDGAPPLAVAGWLFDASKGLVPIWACRRFGPHFGLDEEAARLAGVCGVAGQCWPLFLRFRGGRGISAFVGASALMTDGVGWAAALAPLAGGGVWRVLARCAGHAGGRASAQSKSVPFGCFLGAVAFPLICRWRQPKGRGTGLAPSLVALVLLLRRLTAPLPDDGIAGPAVRREAVIYRLLYDRNTSS